MNARRTGAALLAGTGMIALLLAGTAGANPMGGGMGGTTNGTTMMQPSGGDATAITTMQPGGTRGMGGTTGTTMMQPGGTAGNTTMMQPGGTAGTTMMQPGGTNTTMMQPRGSDAATATTMMQPTGGTVQGHMFTDVAGGDWFAQMAENMASHGFMAGFTDGSFGPDQPLTRGQFAGVMARMMNLPPTAGTSFSDTQGFWGQSMIETMAQMGIITGHTDGSFAPYDIITREQMATIMDRAWQVQHGNASAADMTAAMTQMMQRLTDAGSSWAADHIAWMLQMGVIQGDASGMFRPGALANRAQASAMMWRWFQADQAQS